MPPDIAFYYPKRSGEMTSGADTIEPLGPWREALDRRGWVVISPVLEREAAERLLGELGELREQYRGTIRHEVRFRPGYDGLQYSQSRNGISPHTEAPGLPSPPRYLALHCHRQARCGGGQTLLADGYEFVRSLPPELAAEARRRPIRFDLVDGAGANGARAAPAPVLTEPRSGRPAILRYSYNVLRDNSLDAPTHPDLLDLEGLDPFNAALCEAGVRFVRERGLKALPWDGELLVFDNWRMLHARDSYKDRDRRLTRYWAG